MPKSKRNSPCYCGSKKKYKNCCLKKWQNSFDAATLAKKEGRIYVPILDDKAVTPPTKEGTDEDAMVVYGQKKPSRLTPEIIEHTFNPSQEFLPLGN